MAAERAEALGRVWAVIPRLAGGIVSVPVVIGFVAAGALVVVGRELRDLTRDVWAWRAGVTGGDAERRSDAA